MVSVGPLGVVAFLIAMGASGERGQRFLARLRRLAARGLLIALSVTPTALIMPVRYGALCLAAGFAIAAVSLPIWCYAALAQWLTRDD